MPEPLCIYISKQSDQCFQSLLSPIGQYRTTNITPSKGKRNKKRKREGTKLEGEEPLPSRPPLPEISSFVVVGLNSITRSLESLTQKSKALRSAECEKNVADPDLQLEVERGNSDASQNSQSTSEGRDEALDRGENHPKNGGHSIQPRASKAKSGKSGAGQDSQSVASGAKNEALVNASQNSQTPISEEQSEKRDAGQDAQSTAPEARAEIAMGTKESLAKDEHVDDHFSAIFVPRSLQPPILHAHLPQLVVTASLAHPELPVTRLVQLPKGCDARLSEALGLPRVSFIGILDGAPHSKSLVDLVRGCVPEIEIPWLAEAKKSVYLPVKINAIESFVPVVAQKKQKAV
jgi:hypothetical protein